ncbi:hypothetical protein SH668x_002402 [Planctomicrobium sp. SH668]|uniref:hypothetical protein n=1 Tax=Planctomicrobium sp. SH668 TaxID=3448126 RepID=UPI003F5AEF25
MKIQCDCGEFIYDSTDGLPGKARLIPDREWLGLIDRIEEEVLGALSEKRQSFEAAAMALRECLFDVSRTMYQCQSCGTMFVNDRNGKLHSYSSNPGSSPSILS